MNKSIWWLAVAFLAILLVIPIIWLLVARGLGMTSAITGDAGGLLATIGGVMGAIFAAGGLVIALVSVYTQLTLEARLEERASRVFDEKSPELLKAAEKRVEAYMLFRNAQEALSSGNWKFAEELANQALQLHSDLPGVHSTLGLSMCKLAVQNFVPELQLQPLPLAFMEPSVPRVVHARPYAQAANEDDELSNTAITWLTQAREKDKDSQLEIWVGLALMYGRTRRFEDMKDAIRHCDKLDTNRRNELRKPPYLPVLVHACGNSLTKIRELGDGDLLDVTLPVSEDAVLESLQNLSLNMLISYQPYRWHAMGQPNEWPGESMPSFPITIHFRINEFNGVRQATASYWQYTVTPDSPNLYPKEISLGPEEYAQIGKAIPVSELIPWLSKRFVFICPFTTGLD